MHEREDRDEPAGCLQLDLTDARTHEDTAPRRCSLFRCRYGVPASDDDVAALIARTIHRVDDVTYKLDRALLERLLANPMAFAKGARVVPAVKNSKPSGFKLYAIRPGSLFAALGLTNGDTILSVNGFELTSADRALEVYSKLREASALEIEIERRGKRLTLRYAIE